MAMAKSQIVGIIYADNYLTVQRLSGPDERYVHPYVVGPDADNSQDWRKEIVDALRKADAEAASQTEAIMEAMRNV